MKTSTNKMMLLMGLKIQGDFGGITCYTNKQNKVVWFQKAPPRKPPSDQQVIQRHQFIQTAEKWKMIGEEEQKRWEDLARKAYLRITGYNLFTYWCLKSDFPAIATVCGQAGMSLVLPEPNRST